MCFIEVRKTLFLPNQIIGLNNRFFFLQPIGVRIADLVSNSHVEDKPCKNTTTSRSTRNLSDLYLSPHYQRLPFEHGAFTENSVGGRYNID